MAPPDPVRLSKAESYGRLREWAERLKAFEGVPQMYRDIPSYSESLTADYENLKPYGDFDKKEAFLENHLDYLDSVRQKVQRTDPGYLKLQEIISKEYQNYPGGAFSVGIDPSSELRLFSDLVPGSINTFRGGLMAPSHEIYGHLRPYLLGIQASRDPVTVHGLRGSYKPSIISPTNEAVAHSFNDSLIRYLGRSPEGLDSEYFDRLRTTRFPHNTLEVKRNGSVENRSPVMDIEAAANSFTNLNRTSNDIYTIPGDRLSTYVNSPSPEFTQKNPHFASIVNNLRRSNYLNTLNFTDPLNIPEAARSSISRNLFSKYISPSLTNFREGLRISTPGWERHTDFPSASSKSLNSLDESGNLVATKLSDLAEFNPDKGYSSTDLMIFSSDPVSAAAKGLQELGQGIKRTPSALLPGAADLIPSPEAIRTGYQKGPVEMGKQMGTEFIQSLPAAAASAAVLATPAAAPLAPGIGAGMVGVAGTRALNEVVRQQTGEGIVPKLRQTIGTAPRTGVASPQRRGPAVTPQIRPLNQAQRTEMQRRQNRNELQKRMDLVRERFNPAKGEFGVSELLFGR